MAGSSASFLIENPLPLEEAAVSPVSRLGIGRWEPFVASVVLEAGILHPGVSASAGIGAGPMARIDDVEEPDSPSSRQIIVSNWPVPQLASLLWDAAGLVTASGSPTAHLFEVARSLGVPAVTGVTLPDRPAFIVAVDGNNGEVATVEL